MKQLTTGAAIIVAATLAPAFALTAGLGFWSIVVAVVCGLGMLLASRQSIAVGLIGTVIAGACGVLALQQGSPLFGQTVSGISVARADETSAAFYRFTDGEVLIHRSNDVQVMATSSLRESAHPVHAYDVAPLVGSSWSDADPVPAWVVRLRDQRDTRTPWSAPLHAAVRLNTIDAEDIRGAISAIERHYHLTSYASTPLLRWVADPAAEQIAEWRRLGVIALIGSLIWTAVALGGRLMRRQGSSQGGRRSASLARPVRR